MTVDSEYCASYEAYYLSDRDGQFDGGINLELRRMELLVNVKRLDA